MKWILTMFRRGRSQLRYSRGKLRLALGRLLRKEGLSFRITLNERFETPVKWISRLILGAGIVLSFVTIPFPFSVGISLGLIAIEQVVERVVFFYSTMVVIPMPSPEVWEEASFNSLRLAVYQDQSAEVGMVFKIEDAAREVFHTIRLWNYDQDQDLGDGNIILSFVIDRRKDSYVFFAYPNRNKDYVNDLYYEFEKTVGKRGKEQRMWIIHRTIAHLFLKFRGSSLEAFLKHYKNGQPYDFRPYVGDPRNSSSIIPITSVVPISKNQLRIVSRDELQSEDFEKFFCDYTIPWDEPEDVPSTLWVVPPPRGR